MMLQPDGGRALSYNAQISADGAHGLIVAVEATQAASDWDELLPAVERVEQRTGQKPQRMIADAGYTSRAVIEEMAERGTEFLGRMPREDAATGRTAPHRLPPSAFVYLPERNAYQCPENKLLRPQGRMKKERGLISYRYEAKAEDCLGCVHKPACCPGNQRRGRGLLRLEESAVVKGFREKMASAEAQAHYRRRGRVVEFCHAWIKSKLGLRRFHVRGLSKVRMELLWASLTYNLQHWIRLRSLAVA